MLFNLAHRTSVLRSKFVSRQISASLNGFGDHVFKGAIAAPFLQKQGLPPNALDTYTWTTDGSAEKVRQSAFGWLMKPSYFYCALPDRFEFLAGRCSHP